MDRRSIEEIEGICERSMTAGQLRKAMEGLDQDARVFFVCDYGDYHHTQQALPVEDMLDAEMGHLGTTAYSQSGLCVRGDEGDENGDDSLPVVPIVLLGSDLRF